MKTLKALSILFAVCMLTGCATKQLSSGSMNVPTATATATATATQCLLEQATPPAPEVKTACDYLYYTVDNVTTESVTLTLMCYTCSGMTFGEAFVLEKNTENGYVTVEFGENAAFIEIANVMAGSEERQHTYSWGKFIGSIQPGEYRILADFYSEERTFNAVFEFTVE